RSHRSGWATCLETHGAFVMATEKCPHRQILPSAFTATFMSIELPMAIQSRSLPTCTGSENSRRAAALVESTRYPHCQSVPSNFNPAKLVAPPDIFFQPPWPNNLGADSAFAFPGSTPERSQRLPSV